ncbi:MAG: exporters of the superfamily [bacterium]|nr:exporters of the superfamily [bacterium]
MTPRSQQRPGDARPPAKIFARYVAFAERHNVALLAALFFVMVVSLGFASRLELHTDLAELLPDKHPAVLALRRIAGRQKSATNLVMLIHSPSKEANHKFADALAPKLQAMVPSTFSEVQWKADTEVPEFARKQRWLYTPDHELDDAETLLDRIIAKRGQPGFVDLEGDPDDELKNLRAKLEKRLPVAKGAPSGFFEAEIKGEHYIGVMLWQRLEGFATAGAHDAKRRVEEAVHAVGPAAFDAKLRVDYTGGIAQALDEQNGMRDDLTLATLLCTSLVLLAIYSYFRRIGLLWVIGAPAMLGLLISLFIASVTIKYLNISTAFLISIILGNGINSPIILLGRYGEERQSGKTVTQALASAMTSSVTGIFAAVAAASVAYGCLLLTSFRGFNQFGLLGGAGMLLVGLMTFVLVPPMIIFGERRWPGMFTPRRNLWRIPFSWLGKLAANKPGMLALTAFVAVCAATVPLVKWAKDPLEWNMEKLRSDDTPSSKLWKTMEQLGMGDVGAGYIGNNGVLLVDKPEQADAVAAAMKAQDAAKGPKHVLKEVRTLDSMLPSRQTEKLETLARIRRKIDRHRDMMSADEQKEAEAWRPPDDLHVLAVGELPTVVREAFTETDGQRGRLVGIDADHTTYYDWNGHDLLRMASSLGVDALGQRWVAASAATVFAGMLETIIADGPKVTLWALIGVVTLVLLTFGLRGAPPVLIALGIGMAWLGGIVGTMSLKLNFMNFVALPITLGIGTEYAANIWARIRAEGPSRVRTVITETGSAVALCSLTTIIGYSSLLLSHSRALRSFGLLADIGEVTCLLAAMVALPALVRVFSKPRE